MVDDTLSSAFCVDKEERSDSHHQLCCHSKIEPEEGLTLVMLSLLFVLGTISLKYLSII